MEITETTLHGVVLIAPRPIPDDRGWFTRVFDVDEHARAGIDHTALVQENHSRSRRGVLRGLHTRAELREAKLVRCARGRIFDVAVDLRPWSPTFLRSEHFWLDDERHLQVYLPAGFAHGFQALSEEADVCYRVDAPYEPGKDIALAWNDPELAIPWPLPDPVVSERDAAAPALAEHRPHLDAWFGTAAPTHDQR